MSSSPLVAERLVDGRKLRLAVSDVSFTALRQIIISIQQREHPDVP